MTSTARFSIRSVVSLAVLDSRGNPTVEAAVVLEDGSIGRAAVPSGASTGSREAVELRDGGADYCGRGVGRACANVDGPIADRIRGMNAEGQREIDDAMLALDGSENKGSLGANAILAVSIAVAKAAAAARKMPLYRYLGGTNAVRMPVPQMNILNGGAHASNNVDIQEFMVVPAGASSFSEALKWGVEIYQALKGVLAGKGLSTAVGDEGGFAPDLDGVEAALELIMRACAKAGRKVGREVWLALDCAANELTGAQGGYRLPGESDESFTSEQFAERLAKWRNTYPVISIEDGMAEDDWKGWRTLTGMLGETTQLVGDDVFVTDVALLRKGIADGVANSILIKPNQCGTLSETRMAVSEAVRSGYRTVMSHRSGETEDVTIADMSVAWNCGQIKTGAPSRGERTAKYNRLLRIEAELGKEAVYDGAGLLPLLS